jgi:hypothetical protein
MQNYPKIVISSKYRCYSTRIQYLCVISERKKQGLV